MCNFLKIKFEFSSRRKAYYSVMALVPAVPDSAPTASDPVPAVVVAAVMEPPTPEPAPTRGAS